MQRTKKYTEALDIAADNLEDALKLIAENMDPDNDLVVLAMVKKIGTAMALIGKTSMDLMFDEALETLDAIDVEEEA